MKKIYINPAIQVIKIASQMHILTGSDQEMEQQGDFGTGSGFTLGARSGRNDSWDEE